MCVIVCEDVVCEISAGNGIGREVLYVFSCMRVCG